jgi:hypothetical protein
MPRLNKRFRNRSKMKQIPGTDIEYRFDFDIKYMRSIITAILARKERAENYFSNLFGDVESELNSITVYK